MSDFVIRQARIVPLTTAPAAEPQDVLIRGGRVAQIAPDLAGPGIDGIERIDGEGRWLIPGLWDHHVHLTQWAQARRRLDLSETTDPLQAVRLLGPALAASGAPALIARGHRLSAWSRPPTLTELDAATDGRPVICIAGDAHHAWCNSAALSALGLPITDDGLVFEDEWFDAYKLLPEIVGSTEAPPSAFDAVLADAAAQGVVGLVDLEFAMTPDSWASRFAGLPAGLRIRAATYLETLEEYLAAGLRTGSALPGADPSITMGPLKIISDGSLSSATAWCCEEYVGHPPGTFGAANLDAAELTEALGRAHAHGLEVATHAIGDAAVTQALDAYAATGAGGSIEHAQLIREEDVPRLAELGLRASVQPAHLLDDRDATEAVWPGRGGRCFALRAMLDAGVEVVMGSDAPVSPLDPWLAIAAAVHRSADDRDAWHPEQAITAREALAASVDGRGTVHPGMPADLALLDTDPLADHADPRAQGAALRGIRSTVTWVGGAVVHDAR